MQESSGALNDSIASVGSLLLSRLVARIFGGPKMIPWSRRESAAWGDRNTRRLGYSSRRATMGSTLLARQAGMTVAANATTANQGNRQESRCVGRGHAEQQAGDYACKGDRT